MNTENEGCSSDTFEIKQKLLTTIHSFTALSALDGAMLDAALDRTLHEMEVVLEDYHLLVLDRVLWHFFAKESGLWIGCRTPAGNVIPADVLIMAYTMWRNAAVFAEKRGVDTLKAAAVMLRAVHIAVDDLAKGRSITNVRKYMFGVYRHKLSRITRKHGFAKKVEVTERELSDRGICLVGIEEKILCRELFDAMPPQGKRVALLRYKMGCSWEETAKKLDTSVNAAQKALSVGRQKALDKYMRDRPTVNENGKRQRTKK